LNIQISEIKGQSLQSLKGNWGRVVLLSFIMAILIYSLFIMVELILTGINVWFSYEKIHSIIGIINITIYILLMPLLIGVDWFYLSLARGNNPRISYVLSVYPNVKTPIKLIAAIILHDIFLYLWSLLLFIPGIIKGLAYSQTFYILRDYPELTILEAITESRRKMDGFKWKYFLLELSFIGWGILCLFTLGIGFLWLVPYIATAKATFYNQLINSQNSDTNDQTISRLISNF
jgi:Predicted integral membrane protein